MEFDVAIIGGGPSGSTAGTLLKKYNPNLKVGIFERETFPRDHVGESQLPPSMRILHEMGVWDKVEAANFPVKVGATYRWGKSPELWDLEFIPADKYENEPRPANFEGQRQLTAFQVDRSIYDEILLDHAASMGCEVHEATKVAEVKREGDKVTGLILASGETISARYYIDASGTSGFLRRAMGVHVDFPPSLQNIAIWDYWQNAEWAIKIGVEGTRIQVLSLPYGWIWFIPLGPTRTSVGLVVPAAYYKKTGKRPEDLYLQALKDELIVADLMRNAVSEGKLHTTKDWSNLASRHYGDNWFLVGESAGFADPIVSAGMNIAHATAREAAYTILELDRGGQDGTWLKEQFQRRQTHRINTHIRFADYWYTANAQFKDLKEFTVQLAHEVGLDLEPDKAWNWLAQGGFIDEDLKVGTGGFSFAEVQILGDFLSDLDTGTPLDKNNIFQLDLEGAHWKDRARYANGEITRSQIYERGERVLPIEGIFEFVITILQKESKLPGIVALINEAVEQYRSEPERRTHIILGALRTMEAMINDGWIRASYDPALPLYNLTTKTSDIHWNRDMPKTSS